VTDQEYIANFDRIMVIVRLLLNERGTIAELREIADRVETVGPFLDPTAWIHRRGRRNIEEQLQVLRALQQAIASLLKIDDLRLVIEAAFPHGANENA
jgi:hypothetical protein